MVRSKVDFPGAVRSDHGNHLAGVDGNADAAQRGDAAVGYVQVLDAQQRAHAVSPR